MTHRNPLSHHKSISLGKALVVGVALPAVMAFTVSTAQAQISKSVKSQKSSFGVTMSKSLPSSRSKSASVNRSPSSKSSRVVGKRSSGISSFGTTAKPRSQVTGRSSNVLSRTNSIGSVFQKPSGRSSGLTIKPGPSKPAPSKPGTFRPDTLKPSPFGPGPSKPGPSKPGPSKPGTSLGSGVLGNLGNGRLVPKPPSNIITGDALRDLSSRIPGGTAGLSIIPRPPAGVGNNNGLGKGPVLGGLGKLPDRLGPAPGGQFGNLVGKMPKITENNKKFGNILENLGTANKKPLELKELRKELPKVMLPMKEKLATDSQQFKMIAGAKKTMSMHFGMGGHCHWWADLLCGWHWHRHRCHWVDICAVPSYWSCWTPCHYRIVWCPSIHGHVQTAWYFGIESFLIPDLCALGVHEVSPYSPAALAGLMPGDMILSVNGYALNNESVLPEVIQRSGGILNLEVYRDGFEAPVVVDVRLRRLRITTY